MMLLEFLYIISLTIAWRFLVKGLIPLKQWEKLS